LKIIIENVSDDQTNERKRRMNVIHSKRKRVREKIKVEGMNEQCLGLAEENTALVREGRRLESLLRHAEAIVAESST
jgi:hypothetical protein